MKYLKKYEGMYEYRRELEERDRIRMESLTPLEDFTIGTPAVWYYPQTNIDKNVLIASEPIGDETKRVRIDHVLPNGDTREGGYVNTDELYQEI